MRKNILLLTATVIPAVGQRNLSVSSPDIRLEEYRSALRFYSEKLKSGVLSSIIFAENSGFSLDGLRGEFDNSSIEWISLRGMDYPSTYHRGYGEFKMVDKVMEVSETLAMARPQDAIWKVTGRYILDNIETVVRQAPAGFTVYCDVRGAWAEMSVMAWTVPGFESVLRPLWPSFATDMAPELILARDLRIYAQSLGRESVVLRMLWPTYLIGKRGTDGRSYQGRWGPLRHAARVLDCQIRRIFSVFA